MPPPVISFFRQISLQHKLILWFVLYIKASSISLYISSNTLNIFSKCFFEICCVLCKFSHKICSCRANFLMNLFSFGAYFLFQRLFAVFYYIFNLFLLLRQIFLGFFYLFPNSIRDIFFFEEILFFKRFLILYFIHTIPPHNKSYNKTS